MDKCREEFEVWAVDNLTPFGSKLDKHEEFDAYIDGAVTACFMAWKASRESMKAIKLPEELIPEYEGDFYKDKFEEAYCDGYNEALSLAEDAITLEGYKVE